MAEWTTPGRYGWQHLPNFWGFTKDGYEIWSDDEGWYWIDYPDDPGYVSRLPNGAKRARDLPK